MFEGEDRMHEILTHTEFEVYVRFAELPLADKLRDLR
jgi:hypothetical protein